MKQPIEDQVLNKIQEEHIEPKPRWHFVARNSLLWGAGALSLVVGAVAMAVIIHIVRNNDWDIYRQFDETTFGFFLAILPYLWIALMGLFLLAAHYQLRHTEHGYRLRALVLLVVVICSLGGLLLYKAGIGQAIDDELGERVPHYQQLLNPRFRRWMQPERGHLSGKVRTVQEDGRFTLVDLRRTEWEVSAENDAIPPQLQLREGLRLRLLGQKLEERAFRAQKVLPWHNPPAVERKNPPLRTMDSSY